MISEVINILKSDIVLKTLINGTTEDTHIYPLYTMSNEDCIIYKHVPISDDGIKTLDRLELNIISTSYSHTLEIEDRIKDLLLTIGDNQLTSSILDIEVNGGGALYDGKRNKVQRILFLNILYRR